VNRNTADLFLTITLAWMLEGRHSMASCRF